jgi:hypothetical protein
VNGQVSGTPIPVSQNLTTALPSTTETVALVGTSAANPNCSIPGCATGGVDYFTSNATDSTSIDSNGLTSYEVTNEDAYPLTSGEYSSGATPSTVYLSGGTYGVVARYGGDGNSGGTTYGSSSSTPMFVTVSPESSTTYTCALVSGPASGFQSGEVLLAPLSSPPYQCQAATAATYGQAVTVRADVIGNSSLQESATGTVTLTDNGGPITGPTGGATSLYSLNTEGYLEDTTSFLAVGAHSFVATFQGDASYTASAPSTPVALTVAQGPTTTGVASNPTSASLNESVTLTATVATDSVGNIPTGSVQFLLGGAAFGAPVPVTGSYSLYYADQAIATMVTTSLPNGQNVITAKYLGDTNYSASPVSPSTTIGVGTPEFSLSPGQTCTNATSNITQPGQSASCLISVAGTYGFAGAVTLSAAITASPSGAVDMPACSFGTPATFFTAPNTITLTATNTPGSATMTCSSTAPSHVFFQPSNRPLWRGWPLMAAPLALVCFFTFLSVPGQRPWGLVPLAVLLIVVAVAAFSCGGGGVGGGGNTNPDTTMGNYTITVTATLPCGAAQTINITVDVL